MTYKAKELVPRIQMGRKFHAGCQPYGMRREIPPLRRAPPLRGRKTKTRGFGRDDVMGEMASWRVLSAAAVRRATTNKRYGAGRRPAVRKAAAAVGNVSDGNELKVCAGEPFLCQGEAAPFEAQGKQAV